MARNFNGTSARIHVSSAVVTTTPYTMGCWFRTTNMTQLGALLSLTSSSVSTQYSTLFFRGDVASDPIDILIEAGGAQNVTRSTTGCTSGKWHHACGVFSAANSRTVYLDGGSSATNTTSLSPTINQTEIGAFRSGFWFAGDIAEVGVWNIDLSAAEIAALAKGVSPALIRPQNLLPHLELIREVIDVRRGTAFTEVNTTAAAHPRIYK